jgi:hypothetical protein
MKKAEIKKLISEYLRIKTQINKIQNKKLSEKLMEIEQRYFHETGRTIQLDLKKIT